MISADAKGVANGAILRQGNGILFINYNDPADPSLNHIQGKVFYDANSNGNFTGRETGSLFLPSYESCQTVVFGL